MGSYDPFFDFFNVYGFYFISIAYIALWALSKNILALVVSLETVVTTSLYIYLYDLPSLLLTGGQFVIYGACICAFNKSPLIKLTYLIILATLIFDFVVVSIYEKHETPFTVDLAVFSYYLWFALLPILNFLIIKGLFAGGGGKGYADRLYNNNNRAFYSDSKLFNFIKLRLKASGKASLERVEKT